MPRTRVVGDPAPEREAAARPACPEREAYEAWLTEHGVWWDPRIRLVAPSEAASTLVAHGWGVVARARVAPGEVLFHIPRKACLRKGGAEARARRAAEEVDSQAEIVCRMLHERSLGASSRWAPLLSTLPRDVPTPWRWAPEEQAWLRGTELERPLAVKRARLGREYAAAVAAGEHRGACQDDWDAACAVAISHLNPWWGGCIAPFACMLNAPNAAAGERPGVAYELAPDGRALVGVSLCALSAGQEVTQSYGTGGGICTADLVYRYGFCFGANGAAQGSAGAPPPSDVVSVRADDLRDVARAIGAGGWLEATAPQAPAGPRAGGGGAIAQLLEAARELPATFDARVRLLRAACVLQPSPWDGLRGLLTVELGLANDCAPPCAQSASAGWRRHARWPAVPPGMPELLVACDVLFCLRGGEWERLSAHVRARCAKRQRAEGGPPGAAAGGWAAGLDKADRAAVALAASLSALRAGEWPPAARLEAALAARLRRARASGGRHSGEGGADAPHSSSSSEDGEDGSEDDEPLWEVLAPAESSPSLGLAFASPLAVRAAQACVGWLRLRKFAAMPREAGESASAAPEMAEALHAAELSVLQGCALALDFHAQRLGCARGSQSPQRAPRAADADPCAVWRHLRPQAARGSA